MRIDTLILGGGAAGLWLLDDLTRAGYAALLLESHALGSGQTVASQGIIHGGLKYSLAGLLTDSANAIKHLPALWRDCLAGRAQPDLSRTQLRSDFCHLWSTDSLRSRLGKLGASIALQVKPTALPRDQWPAILAGCTGSVSRLDEQVINPASFIAALADRNRDRMLKIDAQAGMTFHRTADGQIQTVNITHPDTGETLNIEPTQIVLSAGQGNAALRSRLGLDPAAMQTRPLHVTLARGPLPVFNGHCVDGSKTRLTITSDVDTAGRTIWHLGGQVSEDGVGMSRDEAISHVKNEVLATMPLMRSFDWSTVQWATYRIDRAEGMTRGNQRPADAVILHEGRIITCWPTKLVLAPQASAKIRSLLVPPTHTIDDAAYANWPRPLVARPPWEWIDQWTT